MGTEASSVAFNVSSVKEMERVGMFQKGAKVFFSAPAQKLTKNWVATCEGKIRENQNFLGQGILENVRKFLPLNSFQGIVRELGCGRMLSNLLALLQNFQLGGHSSNGMWVSFQAGMDVGLQFGRDW